MDTAKPTTSDYEILQGDCLAVLKTLPDESVQCCVTSPPYFGLRDYGVDGQIGLEPTPVEFIAKMIEVFTEVRRVLRVDGTLWLNLGDSYCSTAPGTWGDGIIQKGILAGVSDDRAKASKNFRPSTPAGLKPKDLMGMPWRVAFALQEAGWWLRQDIIWSKPNPMPESVTDRCTKAHEYIFLLSKSAKYFYDAEAIKEPVAECMLRDKRYLNQDWTASRVDRGFPGEASNGAGMMQMSGNGRNKRSGWNITTKPYSEAHFATFPPELPETCIKAGSRPGDLVLDPFAGAGTTLLVAKRLGRRSIGIELNPEYIKLIERRLEHWHKPNPPKAPKSEDLGPLFDLMGAAG